MNTNPYSYPQCLAILDLCVGLERYVRLDPDHEIAVLLGKNLVSKILEMTHIKRLELIKEVVSYL